MRINTQSIHDSSESTSSSTTVGPSPSFPVVKIVNDTLQFTEELAMYIRDKWVLDDAGLGFHTVSILGSQASGKSTLLNSLFGTSFRVRDPGVLGPTTKGIWMSRAQNANILVADIQGMDDYDFDLKSTLFALATSSVIIFNLWEHQVGLHTGANMDLLKAALELKLRAFNNEHRLTILVVVRDHEEDVPQEAVRNAMDESFRKIWNHAVKPVGFENVSMRGFFNLQFVALPHKKLQKKEFAKQVATLRKIAFEKHTGPHYVLNFTQPVPIYGYHVFCLSSWNQVLVAVDSYVQDILPDSPPVEADMPATPLQNEAADGFKELASAKDECERASVGLEEVQRTLEARGPIGLATSVTTIDPDAATTNTDIAGITDAIPTVAITNVASVAITATDSTAAAVASMVSCDMSPRAMMPAAVPPVAIVPTAVASIIASATEPPTMGPCTVAPLTTTIPLSSLPSTTPPSTLASSITTPFPQIFTPMNAKPTTVDSFAPRAHCCDDVITERDFAVLDERLGRLQERVIVRERVISNLDEQIDRIRRYEHEKFEERIIGCATGGCKVKFDMLIAKVDTQRRQLYETHLTNIQKTTFEKFNQRLVYLNERVLLRNEIVTDLGSLMADMRREALDQFDTTAARYYLARVIDAKRRNLVDRMHTHLKTLFDKQLENLRLRSVEIGEKSLETANIHYRDPHVDLVVDKYRDEVRSKFIRDAQGMILFDTNWTYDFELWKLDQELASICAVAKEKIMASSTKLDAVLDTLFDVVVDTGGGDTPAKRIYNIAMRYL